MSKIRIENFSRMTDKPEILAKVLFWIGSICASLAILFRVFILDRLNAAAQIQMPFGLLFLIVAILSFVVFIFLITNLMDLLKKKEPMGHFTPITLVLLLLILLVLFVFISDIANSIFTQVSISTLSS
ncbi:MAG: hypothetical protein ACFFAE_16750 [Candidatus Hodarchaeota archaeon]